jgi:hypothetical protein
LFRELVKYRGTQQLNNKVSTLLSDDPKMKYLPTGRRRKVASFNDRWSDSQKLECVKTYLILGNLTLTANSLGIPHNTVKSWKKCEWWKTIEQELMVQEDLQLGDRLKKIVNRSYDVIEDRMANGDFVYDQKTGEMRRKPVAMRDAHKVGLDLQVRRDELVRRHVEGESISTDKIEKTLLDLAKRFEDIANGVNKKPVEVTDVIFGETKDAPQES